jgi:hypothetical protein
MQRHLAGSSRIAHVTKVARTAEEQDSDYVDSGGLQPSPLHILNIH